VLCRREENRHQLSPSEDEGDPGTTVAILNRVVGPQGFMLPRFKMYSVKLKSDERVQEEHQNAVRKNSPRGTAGCSTAGRNRDELII
jgi:hypothetical protein